MASLKIDLNGKNIFKSNPNSQNKDLTVMVQSRKEVPITMKEQELTLNIPNQESDTNDKFTRIDLKVGDKITIWGAFGELDSSDMKN